LLSRQADGAFPLIVSEPAFGAPPETEGTANRFKAFVVSQGLETSLGLACFSAWAAVMAAVLAVVVLRPPGSM
jgi:hypothetical protein